MNTIELHVVEPANAQEVAAVMHDALPIAERLWRIVNDPACTTYAAIENGHVVAGAVLRWSEEAEIELLGVKAAERGRGIGKSVVAGLIEEARRRNVQTVLVGTSTIALDNILFYQRCGFRMSHVRRNYVEENFPGLNAEWRGVKLRDIIVFDLRL